MLATQVFATPTAGVLFDNSRSTKPAQVRLANVTGTPGDVRLSGTPSGLTASSGYAWMPTHGRSLGLTVNRTECPPGAGTRRKRSRSSWTSRPIELRRQARDRL